MTSNDPPVRKKVIIRSKDAGIFYGEYEGTNGSSVTVKNAVRLFTAAFSENVNLITLSILGADKSQRIWPIYNADVTIFDAIAMVFVNEHAEDKFKA